MSWCDLTHWGLVTPYGNKDLVQHWFRQWLVAWRHQAITWTNVDLSSVEFCGMHLTTILLTVAIHEMSSKIIFLKLQPHVPGANELIIFFFFSCVPRWSPRARMRLTSSQRLWRMWFPKISRFVSLLFNLTLKQLGYFFQNVILLSNGAHNKCDFFCMKLVQHNEYLVSIVGTDGLLPASLCICCTVHLWVCNKYIVILSYLWCF